MIAGGAPADEFDSEIAGVVAQMPRIKTEKEAVLALSRVFSSAFEAEQFTPEKCVEAARNCSLRCRRTGLWAEEPLTNG